MMGGLKVLLKQIMKYCFFNGMKVHESSCFQKKRRQKCCIKNRHCKETLLVQGDVKSWMAFFMVFSVILMPLK
jgi:hypothetical protein